MRGFLFLACAVAFGQPADLVLRNGKIVTMNAAQPAVEAMAVRGDRIAALGSNADAARWIGPGTKVIDLHGMLAIPGFIEGHGHFTGLGEFRLGLDLRAAPVTKGPRKNNFTLTARAMWRRHSCLPRPDSSGRLLGVLQSASRGVGTRQSETLRHAGG